MEIKKYCPPTTLQIEPTTQQVDHNERQSTAGRSFWWLWRSWYTLALRLLPFPTSLPSQWPILLHCSITKLRCPSSPFLCSWSLRSHVVMVRNRRVGCVQPLCVVWQSFLPCCSCTVNTILATGRLSPSTVHKTGTETVWQRHMLCASTSHACLSDNLFLVTCYLLLVSCFECFTTYPTQSNNGTESNGACIGKQQHHLLGQWRYTIGGVFEPFRHCLGLRRRFVFTMHVADIGKNPVGWLWIGQLYWVGRDGKDQKFTIQFHSYRFIFCSFQGRWKTMVQWWSY